MEYVIPHLRSETHSAGRGQAVGQPGSFWSETWATRLGHRSPGACEAFAASAYWAVLDS